jgi:high-affinity iron transporter
MLASAIIGLREGLEAALIVGIIIGYLAKTGQGRQTRVAWAGVAAAIAMSVLLAIGLSVVGAELEGPAEQVFEGTTMVLAVLVLTAMIFWMRAQARFFKSSLERELNVAATSGALLSLFGAAFLAVFREGVETLRLNLRVFFNVTSVLLLFFAAGLFGHAVHEFQEAGLLPLTIAQVWNLNPILSDQSVLGQILKTLFGYNGAPSLLEVVCYLAYWLLALLGVRWWVNRRAARLQPAAAR